MAIRLTHTVVKTANAPGLIWDDKTPGFCLRVYKGGTKSFVFSYRLSGGVEQRITIGTWPAWSTEAARDRAIELRRLVDMGRDPAGEKRERREAPTITDLVERYVRDHLPKKSADPMRVKDEKRMLAEITKHLGKRTKIVDVHGGDIAEMHKTISESIGRSGQPRLVRANRILAVCSKMFALSLVPLAGENLPWRNAVLGNPCKGIAKNPEEGKERFFSQVELAAISDALARYPGVAADCARLVMLSGCRPAEALKAEWAEFDKEPGLWVKPSSHTKQRKTHRLPLNPAALELIERLRKNRSGKWVFPGDKPGQHLAALWHVWHFVRKEAGLGTDARAYDLRHSFASVGAGGGLSLLIIGKLLGHSSAKTTLRYAHLADDPLREATEKIGAVISGASNGKSAEVLRHTSAHVHQAKGRRS